jgi:hypothetical protein
MNIYLVYIYCWLVTVAKRSMACTVFALLEGGMMGFESHSWHGCLVFVCVCVCVCVCAFFCVCVQVEALRRADHPPKGSYRLSKIWKTEVKRRVSWM